MRGAERQNLINFNSIQNNTINGATNQRNNVKTNKEKGPGTGRGV
jgi:hypothetical protein